MNTHALLESMSILSADMVKAAHANDWDRLVKLEQQMAGIRAKLMRIEPDGRQPADFSEADAAREMSLIATMLENDKEIRRHVEPWLASTRKLLTGTTRDRAVRKAYGAFDP